MTVNRLAKTVNLMSHEENVGEDVQKVGSPIHNIVASLFFLFSGLSAIFVVVCSHVRGFKLMKMPFSAIAVILGLIELGGFALCLGRIDFGLGAGGMQRMILYPILMWLAGFGGYLMAQPDRPTTQKTQ